MSIFSLLDNTLSIEGRFSTRKEEWESENVDHQGMTVHLHLLATPR